MTLRPRRYAVSPWYGVAATLIAVHVAMPSGDWSGAVYMVVATGAVVASWRGAAGTRGPARPAAGLIALGVTLATTGDLIFNIYEWTRPVPPEVSIADVPWLSAYIALGAALFMLLLARRDAERNDVDGAVDVTAVMVVGLLIAWVVDQRLDHRHGHPCPHPARLGPLSHL
jgi:hypothetical protein